MAYIEFHGGMPGHAKTKALARQLGIQRAHAVGHLACLWAYCIERHPGGVIRDDAVEAAAEWEGEQGVLLAALIERRWLERDSPTTVALHDWDDYTKGYRKVVADRERMKAKRSATVARQSTDRSTTVLQNRTERNGTELNGTEKQPCSPKQRRAFVYPEDFSSFYSHYPLKVGKGAGLKAWKKLTDEDKRLATAAIQKQKSWPCFTQAPPDKQPHPERWLNARRWEDEAAGAARVYQSGPRLDILNPEDLQPEAKACVDMFPEAPDA